MPQQRASLLAYLAENEAGPDASLIDPRRSPWARPGWFATASTWIEQSIAELADKVRAYEAPAAPVEVPKGMLRLGKKMADGSIERIDTNTVQPPSVAAPTAAE